MSATRSYLVTERQYLLAETATRDDGGQVRRGIRAEWSFRQAANEKPDDGMISFGTAVRLILGLR
jgi:hypothetical protein